jgi:hypothetical protein
MKHFKPMHTFQGFDPQEEQLTESLRQKKDGIPRGKKIEALRKPHSFLAFTAGENTKSALQSRKA